MSLYLHTNISSMQAINSVSSANDRLDTTYERLSTGLRINSAKDDPAGIQVSNNLTTQIDALDECNIVAQNAISYCQTAESAMGEIYDILQSIRTLAVQSANGTNTEDDRASIQAEVDQLNQEINRISEQTTFGGENMLDGSAGIKIFQISSKANGVIEIDLSCGFSTDSLSQLASDYYGDTFTVGPNSYVSAATSFYYSDLFTSADEYGIDVSTASAAELTIAGIDALLNALDRKRGELGSIENRLESTITINSSMSTNQADARSHIRDTDYASEVSEMTAQELLLQASTTILTQANQRPEIALQMLEG